MDTDCSIEELKQVVLHVSEIEKVEVKQGEPISKEVASKSCYTRSCASRSYNQLWLRR